MPLNRQKILYIITKGRFGGAQRYLLDLTSNLKNSCDITVAYGEGDALAQKLKENGIRTIQIEGLGRDIKLLGDVKAMRNIHKLLKKERPDVLHLNSSKAAGLGSLAARFAGIKKIVVTIHGFPFREDRYPLWTAAIKSLSWVTLCLATDAIFVCKKDLEIAQKWFLKPRLHLIHNGVGPIVFESRENARKKLETLGIKNDFWIRNKYIVGTIAELHKNKGLSYALKALKESPDIGYVIIGEGEERESLEKEIKKSGLENQTCLTGFVENADSLVKAFDIFLLPSVKEGLPYVLLEAGNAEMPVIATDTGGVSEIIKNGKTGILIRLKNPKEITDSLSYATKNPKESSVYGKNLKTLIASEFSLEKMASATEKLYFNN